MSYRIKVLIILSIFTLSNSADAGAISKGRKLACQAILCAIGVAIPESKARCTKVLHKWSVYAAALGPFTSKPKCPKKNKFNQIVGDQEMRCDLIQNAAARKMCEDALSIPSDCSKIQDRRQRFMCEEGCTIGDNRPVCRMK